MLVVLKKIRGVPSAGFEKSKGVEQLDDTECTTNSTSDLYDDREDDPIIEFSNAHVGDSMQMALIEAQHELREKASQGHILRETLSIVSVKMNQQECELQGAIAECERKSRLLEEKTNECVQWKLKCETAQANLVEYTLDRTETIQLLEQKTAECEEWKVKCEKLQAQLVYESLQWKEKTVECERNYETLQAKQIEESSELPIEKADSLASFSAVQPAIDPLIGDLSLVPFPNHPWRCRNTGALLLFKKDTNKYEKRCNMESTPLPSSDEDSISEQYKSDLDVTCSPRRIRRYRRNKKSEHCKAFHTTPMLWSGADENEQDKATDGVDAPDKQEIGFELMEQPEQIDHVVGPSRVDPEEEEIKEAGDEPHAAKEEDTKTTVTHQDQVGGDSAVPALEIRSKAMNLQLDDLFNCEDDSKSVAALSMVSTTITVHTPSADDDTMSGMSSSDDGDSVELYNCALNTAQHAEMVRARVIRRATKEAQKAHFAVETVEC